MKANIYTTVDNYIKEAFSMNQSKISICGSDKNGIFYIVLYQLQRYRWSLNSFCPLFQTHVRTRTRALSLSLIYKKTQIHVSDKLPLKMEPNILILYYILAKHHRMTLNVDIFLPFTKAIVYFLFKAAHELIEIH